ncbi:glutathione S-transferase family protein [Sphingomonas sp. 28-63-12]|uniref:glutathione S-transferase family protein n=1 Tax=Sphingomonas sp. 28-63-12 TaxID=1970434 RepID=UPI000BD03DCE|nr:MAG: glutathione S-transferase [Sphingomonas sp. 28-63-12]
MIVYGSTISPFVRKVMAFAAEKGLTLRVEAAGLGQGGPDFVEASPFGKIPGFRDPGADGGMDFCISDSTAICAYLEAKYPEPNMIPVAPIARARTVWFEEYADTIFFASAAKIFANRVLLPKILKRPFDEAIAAAAESVELPPLLDYLERVIPASGFLVEDRITLADIAVCSPFVNLAHTEMVIDPVRWPITAAYVAAVLARPSFAPMVAAERAIVAAMG